MNTQPPAVADLVQQERAKYERMWTHDDYRTFSPGLFALENLNLVAAFRQLGVRTVLDAGCGSGKFMRRLLEAHAAEFSVRGFDIAGNCLDPWFAGRAENLLTLGCLWEADALPRPNDAVVCTDVLEHIPTEHVPAVLANLRTAATKAVFVGIALFPDGFGPEVIGAPLHLTVQSAEWWQAQLRAAGLQPLTGVVQKNEQGTPLWLYVLARPAAG